MRGSSTPRRSRLASRFITRPVDRRVLLRPCGRDVSRTSDSDGHARAGLRQAAPPPLHMSAFTTRPELSGTFGMVACTHWLAAAAGMAVLEQGGNAFDAAVAAGLALQVVEP